MTLDSSNLNSSTTEFFYLNSSAEFVEGSWPRARQQPGYRTPSTPQSGWVLPLFVLIAGMFMSVLDVTIVNVAVPSIATDLGAFHRIKTPLDRYRLHAHPRRGRTTEQLVGFCWGSIVALGDTHGYRDFTEDLERRNPGQKAQHRVKKMIFRN